MGTQTRLRCELRHHMSSRAASPRVSGVGESHLGARELLGNAAGACSHVGCWRCERPLQVVAVTDLPSKDLC